MERLYHYLWKYKMLGREVRLTDGQPVTIVDPGLHNNDAGPDFFNAKLLIDGTEWAGNVEIHVKSSDWYNHGHHHDKCYDSVVVHAVGVADKPVFRTDGSRIPQLEIRMPKSFFETVGDLVGDLNGIRCRALLKNLTSLTVNDWLETLSVERMQEKAKRITDVYDNCDMDWEQASFVALSRALGFGLNSEPFEIMARSLPLRFLKRHIDNPLQVEALLFGQAGMLDTSIHIFDEYYQLLCREYYFLARKYGLRPMRSELWKYSRTRPQNFPHRRIAFLARMLISGLSFPSDFIACDGDLTRLRALFSQELTGYWLTHSDFDVEASVKSEKLSATSVDLLLINFISPLYYAISSRRGDLDMAERAFKIMESLSPERNSLISQWDSLGLKSDNALRSQALLQLRKEYCDRRKCLSCRFGHSLLRKSAQD